MKAIGYAIKGIKAAYESEVNLKIHLIATIIVLIAGWYFKLNLIEWIVISICIGLVISMELINTAIEHMVDFFSPAIHPTAGKIKDISAGAVLVISLTALITGLIIFFPKILALVIGAN